MLPSELVSFYQSGFQIHSMLCQMALHHLLCSRLVTHPDKNSQALSACLDAFERFMHENESHLPPLIKAGLLHVQFETIHPFLDGNGRIGRLLVTLYLCVQDVLHKPLLYLSFYLKTHRADYYRLLQEVRERGAWEAWLEFFLDGVTETANQAFDAPGRGGGRVFFRRGGGGTARS